MKKTNYLIGPACREYLPGFAKSPARLIKHGFLLLFTTLLLIFTGCSKKGDPGIDGLNGKNGINGTDGTNGKDGAAGAKGATGDAGTTGTTGDPGINGALVQDFTIVAGGTGWTKTATDYIHIFPAKITSGTILVYVAFKSKFYESLPSDMFRANSNLYTLQDAVQYQGNIITGVVVHIVSVGGPGVAITDDLNFKVVSFPGLSANSVKEKAGGLDYNSVMRLATQIN